MKPPRILGLQLKRLGDVILTTPAMHMLQQTFPAAVVDLMVDRKLRNLAPYITGCNVIAAPQSPADYLRLFRANYDVVLDFTGQDRCLLLAALSRAQRKVTFRKYFKKPGRNLVFGEAVKSSLRDRHISDHLADLAIQAGGTAPAGPPTLRCLPADQISAHAKMTAAGFSSAMGSPYLLLHPGTARAEKSWTPCGWGKVIDYLSTRTGLPVLLTSSPDSVEKSHLAKVAAAAQSSTVQLAGNLSLGEFFAVIAGASLLAGVDSAPVHIAEAFNTPIFALYGPTNPAEWGPHFSPHEIIQSPRKLPESESMALIDEDYAIQQLGTFILTLPLAVLRQ
jgi:ADP-heptose:LPS heptosyltransferase